MKDKIYGPTPNNNNVKLEKRNCFILIFFSLNISKKYKNINPGIIIMVDDLIAKPNPVMAAINIHLFFLFSRNMINKHEIISA